MLTILIVDDEPANRLLVRRILGPSYTVIDVDSAAAACEVMRSREVDLVLLDMMMPQESGVDAVPRIKALSRNGFVPVVMLTALDDRDNRHAALSAGADDYLTKPVDPRDLRLRVECFLRIRCQEQELRAQHDELHKVLDLKDDLFGLLVHDLRNPLTSVIGMLQLLKEEGATAEAVEDASLGLVAAQRVGAVIEDILQLVALEAGELQLMVSTCSLAAVATDAFDTVQGAARRRNVGLRVYGDARIEVDQALLRRALENLLANAIRYAPQASEVLIDISQSADSIVIAVGDRGPGVPEEKKRSLFLKFGGISRTVEDVGRRSYGFGLYLVDLVARAHHGETRVVDRVGGGSSFELALPRQRLCPARECDRFAVESL